jgi:para-aminobenzoate synthetase
LVRSLAVCLSDVTWWGGLFEPPFNHVTPPHPTPTQPPSPHTHTRDHPKPPKQVCLTGQLSATLPTPTDPFHLYRRLRQRNPAPFAAFLRHDPTSRLLPPGTATRTPAPAIAICCSSPERFLRVSRGKQGKVESKPIKGTVRRGQGPEEDAALAAGLAACEKNRAENLMIVDLVRNDVARVCRPGSVRVPRLMAVETYATVHQLVSTVAGELAPGRDAVDAIVASFPGGSMTGAPKKRTMEIIERLEGGGRGPYSGALGYISLDGLAADLNIVIRTAVVTPGEVTVGAGGAIVALSERENEYAEMILKARAVAGALGSAPPPPPVREQQQQQQQQQEAAAPEEDEGRVMSGKSCSGKAARVAG